MNPSASSGFYGRNRQKYTTGPPTGGPSNSDDVIHSLLHSISCSLRMQETLHLFNSFQIQACVRRVYAAFNEDDKYSGTEG